MRSEDRKNEALSPVAARSLRLHNNMQQEIAHGFKPDYFQGPCEPRGLEDGSSAATVRSDTCMLREID